MELDVSIIIVSYNTSILTRQCIRSIYNNIITPSFEIILVDNNSIDSTVNDVKEEFPDVVLIRKSENLGFGRANNIGAGRSYGKFLWFLNSDTILIEDNISKFIIFMDSDRNQDVGACGAILTNTNGAHGISYGNFPSIWEVFWSLGLRYIFKGYFERKLSSAVVPIKCALHQVDFISGANLFIRKGLFTKLNGFDEDFFMYCEEAELCYRIKGLGLRNVLIGSSSLIHLEGGSQQNFESFNPKKFEMIMRSRLLFFKKCYGRIVAIIAAILLCLRAVGEGIACIKPERACLKIGVIWRLTTGK